jgi:hypothetical protein
MASALDLPELCIQSHGIGQESAALHEMWRDTEFRKQYGGKTIIAVSADTGDEKPETTRYSIYVLEPRLQTLRIPYRFIATTDGYHTGAWANGGLINQFRTNQTFGAVAFQPSCSHSLKISVIYNWLERYVEMRYGYAAGQKRGLKEFARAHGKIRMIIGFAKGEESRIADASGQLGLDLTCIDRKEAARSLDGGMYREDVPANRPRYGPSCRTKVRS